MATPESAVVRATIRALDAHGATHWNHSPSGETGIPDRFAVYHGRLLAIECKRPRGGRVSPKQQWWLDRLAAAGAICLIVTDAAQVREVLCRIDAEEALAEEERMNSQTEQDPAVLRVRLQVNEVAVARVLAQGTPEDNG